MTAARKKSQARKRDKVLIRSVRVELVRPMCGRTWDDLGSDLRGVRHLSSRAINAAITACELTRVAGWNVPVETCAYRAVQWELAGFRAWAAEHKDDQVQHLASIEPAGGTLSAWAKHAHLMWKRWLKEGRRTALPTTKSGAPIMVRHQEWEFTKSEQLPVISVRLLGKHTHRHQIMVKAGRGGAWATLRLLQSGELARRDMKLVYSPSKKKWFAILSYEEPEPAPKTGKHVLIVHRGCRNFLTFLRDDGRYAKEPGTKVLAYKQKMRARARSMQAALSRSSIGSGARGHGRSRRHKSIDTLHDKETRFLDTFIKQTVSRALTLAKQWDCGTIVWEDYGGIEPSESVAVRRFIERFPLFKLGTALEWGCKREGFQAHQVPSFFISSKCPVCGAVDVASHNKRTGIFHCTAPGCGFDRPADWVAAFWMLHEVRPNNEVKRKLAAVRKLEKKLQEEKE